MSQSFFLPGRQVNRTGRSGRHTAKNRAAGLSAAGPRAAGPFVAGQEYDSPQSPKRYFYMIAYLHFLFLISALL
jgi:hypothetical protein